MVRGRTILFVLVVIATASLVFGRDDFVTGQFDALSLTDTPNIRVDDFKMTRPSPDQVRLSMTASSKGGMRIGSFMVYVVDYLPGHKLPKLPGMEPGNGRMNVVSTDYTQFGGRPLKDNGKLDEDSRVGCFTITLDVGKWPAGRYYVTLLASNVPLSPGYYIASRVVPVDVGDVALKDESENVPGAQTRVIWRNKNVYACFPTLMELKQDRLLTRFGTKLRSSHIDPLGGSLQMVSADNGWAWSITKEPFPDPAERTPEGHYVKAMAEGWVYVSQDHVERLKRERYTTKIPNASQVAYLSRKAFAMESDDGIDWQKRPIAVPDDILGMLTFRSITTSKGIRLVSVYGHRSTGPDTRSAEAFFLRSEDQGKSWKFIYNTPHGLPEGVKVINETAIHETANGNIVAMHRTSDHTDLYRSISSDGGKTWSTPEDTGIWGYPADMATLPDGRLVCVYGYRRYPMGIRACVSYDNGKTWDTKREMILRADGLAAGVGDLGYPRITLLPDGSLFTIYYIATDSGMPYIAGTHFRVPPALTKPAQNSASAQ